MDVSIHLLSKLDNCFVKMGGHRILIVRKKMHDLKLIPSDVMVGHEGDGGMNWIGTVRIGKSMRGFSRSVSSGMIHLPSSEVEQVRKKW